MTTRNKDRQKGKGLVFVTGATGFVGRAVVRELVEEGWSARCLVREGSEGKLDALENVEIRHGDVTEPETLAGALAGCTAVIHLVGIIREIPSRKVTFERLHVEATANMLDAAARQGVRRYLHMSSNGTRPDAVALYHRTKWQAEENVRASGLDWTIFRPSLIFGPGGEFVTMLADLIRKMPVVPVIGDGQYRMQPVAVEEVAASFVRALAMPATVGRSYHLGGETNYTYDEILDLTGRAVGVGKVSKTHQPLFLVKPMVKLMENAPGFPLTSDQLIMLLEGNVCDPSEWAKTFGIEPTSYAKGIGGCFS